MRLLKPSLALVWFFRHVLHMYCSTRFFLLFWSNVLFSRYRKIQKKKSLVSELYSTVWAFFLVNCTHCVSLLLYSICEWKILERREKSLLVTTQDWVVVCVREEPSMRPISHKPRRTELKLNPLNTNNKVEFQIL